MDKGLDRLNSLSQAGAQAEFLKCCGSTRWAAAMTGARPFTTDDDLAAKADDTWWSLNEEDWLEAFRAHPKIGERKAAAPQSDEARKWSADEQSRAQQATTDTKAALAEANRTYEQRFGFIFIICASGKSAEEILSTLDERLPHDRAEELRAAAEEQRKITRLRLQKLVETEGP